MKPDTRSFYERAVHKAVEHVVSNLDRALDLQALARLAALAPFHFHRVFRGAIGETPLELHRRLRLERSAFQLRHEEVPITAVAFTAGYETHDSFTRAFRSYYQRSPSEFRQGGAAEACARSYPIELPARSGIHFRPRESGPLQVQLIRGEHMMDVEIKDMPELHVATVRHTGPYNRISEAFARLGEIAKGTSLIGPGGTMLALYYDDPETTPASELRADAALVIPKGTQVPAGLGEQRIPGGRYACTTHVGPYEELGDSWARLMGEWLPQSGERMSDGISYEIYRNMPMTAPKDKLQTELYLPLT